MASCRRKNLDLSKKLGFYKGNFASLVSFPAHILNRFPNLVQADIDNESHRFVLVHEDFRTMAILDPFGGVDERQTKVAIQVAARQHAFC